MRRKRLTLILAALLSTHAAGLQTAGACRFYLTHGLQAEEAGQAAQVKAAVLALSAQPKTRVRVSLRDLSEFKGRAAEPGDDSFVLVVRVAKGIFVERRVEYREVLELRGGEFSLSFIPDPRSRPYGSWEAVRRLEFGDSVELLLGGGGRCT